MFDVLCSQEDVRDILRAEGCCRPWDINQTLQLFQAFQCAQLPCSRTAPGHAEVKRFTHLLGGGGSVAEWVKALVW